MKRLFIILAILLFSVSAIAMIRNGDNGINLSPGFNVGAQGINIPEAGETSVSGNFTFYDGNNVVFYDTNNFIFGG